MVIFHCFLYVYQRVTSIYSSRPPFSWDFPWNQPSILRDVFHGFPWVFPYLPWLQSSPVTPRTGWRPASSRSWTRPWAAAPCPCPTGARASVPWRSSPSARCRSRGPGPREWEKRCREMMAAMAAMVMVQCLRYDIYMTFMIFYYDTFGYIRLY